MATPFDIALKKRNTNNRIQQEIIQQPIIQQPIIQRQPINFQSGLCKPTVDTHAWLSKDMIKKDKQENKAPEPNVAYNNIFEKIDAPPPVSEVDAYTRRNIIDVYTSFETRYRALGNFTSGQFGFNLSTQKSDIYGNIGTLTPTARVIEMEIFPFLIPNSFITNAWTPLAYFTMLLKYIRLAIFELPIEAIWDPFQNYHFEFTVASDNHRYLQLTPSRQKYTFSKELSLEKLTFGLFAFGAPLNMNNDKYTNCTINYLVQVEVETADDNGLVTNEDAIIFENVPTAFSNANPQFINYPYGHMIQTITTKRFKIPLLNGLTLIGVPPVTVNIFVVARNIHIPMRFRVIQDKFTNGIIPT
jgi:hypothetical protein